MLEEKDLQAIAQLMDSRIGESEKRMDQRLAQQKQDIMSETKDLLSQQKQEILDETTQRMKVLLDTEVTPKFNLLAENQSIMMEKLERLDDIEVMDTRITALEAMVKKLNRDVEKLKKAQ